MCGIIAYQGRRDARKVIWRGLHRLEYRGYDSWGIGVFQNPGVRIFRKVGKISETRFASLPLPEDTHGGLGHTRWATHGGLFVRNAHPHLSQSGRVVVVHNGIVENFCSLKKELQREGYRFRSQTDTEVIANLVDFYSQDLPFQKAVRKAFQRLQGRNAFVAYDVNKKLMAGIKKGSPLIFGRGGKEDFFLASDVAAFSQFRPEVKYLDDDEMVVIKARGFSFYQAGKEQKEKASLRLLDQEVKVSSKMGYPHFMLKEIEEQAYILKRVLEQNEQKIQQVGMLLEKASTVYLLGAGTAGRVAHFGQYLFQNLCRKQSSFIPACEFKNFAPLLGSSDVVIAISQSGETADTLEAVQTALKKGARVISLVNVPNSTLDRIADYSLPTRAGTERAVASTKATTAQLALLTFLVFACWGKISEGERVVLRLGQCVKDVLCGRTRAQIKRLARKLSKAKDIYIIGRDFNYPIALEAAIKFQEVSYIHAQGFAGGELKHGPLALIEKGVPVIVLSDQESRAEVVSNAQEVKSRGGLVIGISEAKEEIFDHWLKVPAQGILQAIINLIPIQLLAYYLSVLRGVNPDMPRNLAKSVTVK